jgi:epoxyqueuosine reductase QueG
MSLSKLLNTTLSWQNRAQWNKAVQQLELFFKSTSGAPDAVTEKARLLKNAIEEVDAFIQHHTAKLCPLCQKVCCMNRFSYYDREDLIYIHALGLKPPAYKKGIDDTHSCQFISGQGCTIERTLRPFRCNWYFCIELISHMEAGPAKSYREFILRSQKIIEAKRAMVDEFSRVAAHD